MLMHFIIEGVIPSVLEHTACRHVPKCKKMWPFCLILALNVLLHCACAHVSTAADMIILVISTTALKASHISDSQLFKSILKKRLLIICCRFPPPQIFDSSASRGSKRSTATLVWQNKPQNFVPC